MRDTRRILFRTTGSVLLVHLIELYGWLNRAEDVLEGFSHSRALDQRLEQLS